MKFSVFQLTRKGGREINEDRMGYLYTQSSGLFVLADGMGGHPEGEVAAQLALQSVSALYHQQAHPKLANVSEFLTIGLMSAHHNIIRYASEKGMLDTPRSTLVMAVIQDRKITWMHCGDSRLYVVRKGKLLVRTRDHSYSEYPNAGPAGLVNRNVLFTCLGSPTRPIFDVSGPIELEDGDRILLCSDGLWDALSEDEIIRSLSHGTVAQTIPDIVERALQIAGSKSDNVTAIGIEWEALKAKNPETTTGFPPTDAQNFDQLDEMDDAAIERSIAEINAAIHRRPTKTS